MASIHVDSELMRHQIAAQPISTANGKRFFAVLDGTNRPLAFAVGTDNRLYAVKSSPIEQNQQILIDLSAILDVQGAIQAIAVSQAGAGKNIYLAFSRKLSSSDSTDLYVLAPFKPEELDTDEKARRLQHLMYSSVGSVPAKTLTHRLLLGDPAALDEYPLLFAVFTDAAKQDDVARVRVDLQARTWEWKRDVYLAEGAKSGSITDVCLGNTVVGPGLFCLYENGGVRSLGYTTVEDGARHYRTDLKVQQDAKSLATFKDTDGYTHLLIGGGGLTCLTPDRIARSGSTATMLSASPMYKVVEHLHVAQAGDSLSIWFETGDAVLGYQHGYASSPSVVADDPIPLRAQGEGAEFAAILDPSSKSQSLLVVSEQGALMLMEQASDTLLWRSTPYAVRKLDKMLEYNSYTSRIEIEDATGWPLADSPFLLCTTSGWLTLVVNGSTQVVSTSGVEVKTDSRGTITTVMPADDLASHVLVLRNVRGGNRLNLPDGYVLDPTLKVQAKLAEITDGNSLRNAKTASGKSLLGDSKATKQDLDKAATAIQQLHGVMSSVPRNGTSSGPRMDHSLTITGAGTLDKTQGAVWEFYNWVKDMVETVKQLSVTMIRGTWHFLVELADKAYNFVLDTAAKVAKAISFVLEKIGAAWDSVVEWLGFVFNWDDIKHTRDSIKAMVNGALTFGANFMTHKADVVESWFEGLELKVKAITGVPEAVLSQVAGADGKKLAGEKASDLDQCLKSAPANYGTYHIEHGGVKQATMTGAIAGDKSMIAVWEEVIKPLYDQVVYGAQTFGQQVIDLFNQAREITGKDIVRLGGQLVLFFLGIIKVLAVKVIKLGASIISGLRDILNKPIHVPVISFVLNELGVPLPNVSVLDVVSIILAIPTTVLAKMITGSAPKRIDNFDFDKLVDGANSGTFNKEALLAYNELGSYVQISAAMVGTIYKTYQMMTAEIPEVAKPVTFSAIGLTVNLIGKLVTFPFDTESPGWGYRIGIWGILTGNVFIKAVCAKAGVSSAKVVACFDVAAAIHVFYLNQVIHGLEYAKDWKGKDAETTTMNVASSIFALLGSVGGAYGVLNPEPLERGISVLVVACAGGCGNVISGGKAYKAVKKGIYNNVVDTA